MKKIKSSPLAFLLAAILAVGLSGCGNPEGQTGLWESAAYTEDTSLGEGAKELVVEVAAGARTVTFTFYTDETTVGAALLEEGLIAGDEGEYGLYIKQVNGITADYDIDQSYWAFYIDGEYALSGADTTEITEGAVYRFEYTK